MDTDNPYDDDLSRFAVAFMRSVIAWNNAEDRARQILIAFGGRGMGLTVTVEQLGSIALRDSLNTLCDALSFDDTPDTVELASHIAHFVEGMDTLRAYRNFYVHALKSTGKAPDNPKTFRGFLHAVEARGRYAFVQQHISMTELEGFMFNTLVLHGYGNAIARSIPGDTNALAPYAGEPTPLASIGKPTWPKKLTKRRNYLRERPPQHQSSPE